MTTVQIARRAYFEHLRWANEADAIRRVVAQVREALDNHGLRSPPIVLSAVASCFDIVPTARFDSTVRDGRIVYCSSSAKFIITLCDGFRPSSPGHVKLASTTERPESASHDELHGRARFTYAHEFAHRFFFAKREDEWVRAIELAAFHVGDPSKRLAATAKLVRLEEELVNEIAGRLLVPEGMLVEELRQWNLRPEEAIVATSEQRGCLGKKFGVSTDCIRTRLAKLGVR